MTNCIYHLNDKMKCTTIVHQNNTTLPCGRIK